MRGFVFPVLVAALCNITAFSESSDGQMALVAISESTPVGDVIATNGPAGRAAVTAGARRRWLGHLRRPSSP